MSDREEAAAGADHQSGSSQDIQKQVVSDANHEQEVDNNKDEKDTSEITNNEGQDNKVTETAVSQDVNEPPATETQGRSSATGRPSSATGRPSSATGRPSSATGRPSSATRRPSSATGRPSSATGRPSSATGRPSSGRERPSSGTERPSSGTQRLSPRSERPSSGSDNIASSTETTETTSEERERPQSARKQPSPTSNAPPSESSTGPESAEQGVSSSTITEAGITEEKTMAPNMIESAAAMVNPEEAVVTAKEVNPRQTLDKVTEESVGESPGGNVVKTEQVAIGDTKVEASSSPQEGGSTGELKGISNNAEQTEASSEATTKKVKRPVKALTEEEVTSKTTTLMEKLASFETYDNSEVMETLKSLGRLYFNQKRHRPILSKILLEKDFAGLTIKFLVAFNQIGIFKSDDVWFPAYYTLNDVWNYTDCSKELAKDLVEKGMVPLMIANVTHQPYLENAKSKNVNYVLKSSLSILQNVSKVPEAKPIFVENNAIEVLKGFTNSENEFFKAVSMMALTSIISDADNAVLEDTGTITFMIRGIELALKAKTRRYRGFSPTEIAECLGRMAVNDKNKIKIVKEGALPLLTEMLQYKDEAEQRAAAQCLWTLSFDTEVRSQILVEPGCIEALENLTASDNKAVQKSANGAMWKLKGEEQHEALRKESEPKDTTTGHVMISYNWGHQELILKICEKLKADGYKVWIDVEQMGGSTLGAMAQAVEDAAVVIVCMSEKYKISPNCRTEGEYTFQLHKPIVPILVQRRYRADGWLGMLLGAKLFTDFSKHAFDKAYAMLIKEIKGRGHPQLASTHAARTEEVINRAAPRPETAVKSATLSEQILSWSTKEVAEWLSKNGLESCQDAFAGIDGSLLSALMTLRSEAPEFFYNTIEKKFCPDVQSMLRLINAMSTLS